MAKRNYKTTRCGTTYSVCDFDGLQSRPIPKLAKYRVVFWGSVRFFSNKEAAIDFQSGLPYYQQEDSEFSQVRK